MRMYTRRIIKAKLAAPQIEPTHAPKQNPSAESDSFYYKLNQLWDSFGLGLIINARNTSLDLFLFYSEVTRRGGYHQVSRDRKWDELVSALKLEGNSPKLSVQLEKCYGLLLYQYELLYYYRDPAVKASANSNSLGLLTNCISPERKRKYEVCLFELTGSEDNEEEDEEEAEMCTEMSGSVVVEPKMVVQASPDDKKVKKRGGKSPRPRTAYQIFIKEECARLRSCNLASPRTNILYMAIDAWRSMTEVEKQPYVDESMKEKGRLMEAGKSLQLDVESGSDGLELVMSKEKPRGIHTKW